MDVLEGSLEVIRDFATMVDNLSPKLMGMADSVGAVFAEVEPQIFGELQKNISAAIPLFTDLIQSGLRMLPGLLAYLRTDGLEAAQMFIDFAGALAGAIPPIVDVGNAIISIVIPPLVWLSGILGQFAPLVDVVTGALGTLAAAGGALYAEFGPVIDILGSIIVGVFGVLAAGSGLVSLFGTLAGVAGTIGSALVALAGFANPVTVALLGIAGAVAGVLSYFGLLGDAIDALKGAWNTLLRVFSGDLSPVKAAIEGIANLAISGLNALLTKISDTIPGVSLEPFDEVEIEGSDSGGGGGGEGGGPGSGTPPVPPGSGGGAGGGQAANVTNQFITNDNSTTKIPVDASGGGSQQEARIQAAVERALREERARQGQQRRRENPGN
jgi:phage-related protein